MAPKFVEVAEIAEGSVQIPMVRLEVGSFGEHAVVENLMASVVPVEGFPEVAVAQLGVSRGEGTMPLVALGEELVD